MTLRRSFFAVCITLLVLVAIPESSQQNISKTPEMVCVSKVLSQVEEADGYIFLGLDYWDARRFKFVLQRQDVQFIQITDSLDYYKWMTERENFANRINLVYWDDSRKLNHGDSIELKPLEMCGPKTFYRVSRK
jgi:hypothetical protein